MHRVQESRAGGATKWIVSRANAIPPPPPLPNAQTTSLCLKEEPRGIGFQPHCDAMYRPPLPTPVSSNKVASYTLPYNPPKASDHAVSGPIHLGIAGNEKLYEAYNELHTLAQEFHKPFDAPAILVVGHQTDGKSALVEALMGFQFNHVGGGTKTRRLITLHMKYNAACAQPRCFLVSEDQPDREKEQTLEEIQVLALP